MKNGAFNWMPQFFLKKKKKIEKKGKKRKNAKKAETNFIK